MHNESEKISLTHLPQKSQSLIYKLFNKDECVYVGQCRNGLQRVIQHWTDGQKEFDSFTYAPCDPFELDYLEYKEIIKLKPKYNKNIKAPQGYISSSQAKNLLGAGLYSLMEQQVDYERIDFDEKVSLIFSVADIASWYVRTGQHDVNVWKNMTKYFIPKLDLSASKNETEERYGNNYTTQN